MNDRSFRVRALFARTGAVAVAALVMWSTGTARAASGDVTRSQELAPFERVTVDGAFTVTVVAGSATAFSMTGPADEVDRVTVAVEDGHLSIGMEPHATHVHSIVLSIATPTLRAFENRGAGFVRLSGLHGDVDVENRGTATIDAAGHVAHLTIVNDGVGKIDAVASNARDATVTNDGVGSISVRASGSLVMNVDGIGEIRYAGEPAHVESHVNGLGVIGRV